MDDSRKTIELVPVELLTRRDPEGRLSRYYDLLRAENRKINLVSRETIDSGLETLAAESLLPFEYLPEKNYQNYLDIGSGGGFPAFPVILTKDISHASLVERTSKKAQALKRIAGGPLSGSSTAVDIVDGNFEDLQFDARHDLVTLRLVTLTRKLLKKIESVMAENAIFIYYATPDADCKSESMSGITYCYHTSVDAPTKSFTIFRKNR